MARLVDLASGHSLELPSRRTTFGTAPDNHIPMAEGFGLSPRHFQVTPVPGGMVLVDMTGQQATLVNEAPVSQVALRNGDVIRAGNLMLRYESQPVPPPLPPEMPALPPPQVNEVAPSSAGLVPGPACLPLPQQSYSPRSLSKQESYESAGRTSLPNVATAVHLYKWMLPAMGLILWAAKWCYNIYSVKHEMNRDETRSVAYELVETFRQAREARAPLIDRIHDAGHAVRALVRGVPGSGDYADVEFKVEADSDQAEDALSLLMWTEGEGLVFKHEYRDRTRDYSDLEESGNGAEESEEVAGETMSLDDI